VEKIEKQQPFLLLVYQEQPDYQAHTTSYGEVRHIQYIPSMRAIQTTSHKINHKKVSISQKECRIHNIKVKKIFFLFSFRFNLTSYEIHCMYKCLITHYVLFKEHVFQIHLQLYAERAERVERVRKREKEPN
jgi:hypothetical protein